MPEAAFYEHYGNNHAIMLNILIKHFTYPVSIEGLRHAWATYVGSTGYFQLYI